MEVRRGQVSVNLPVKTCGGSWQPRVDIMLVLLRSDGKLFTSVHIVTIWDYPQTTSNSNRPT